MTPWNPFHVREYLAGELDTELRRVFSSVRVQGMFATPTVYEVELARVDAARRRIRARDASAAARPKPGAAAPRPLPIRVAKRLVPAALRAQLRLLRARSAGGNDPAGVHPSSIVQPAGSAPAVDLETFLRFSTADLFYADTDLERAMDFMAVCRVD